jgi:hypothetical protein
LEIGFEADEEPGTVPFGGEGVGGHEPPQTGIVAVRTSAVTARPFLAVVGKHSR